MTCPDCSKLLAECDEAARRIAALERREARMREALGAVMRHPHIRAYLPYDPIDETMREAIAALRD